MTRVCGGCFVGCFEAAVVDLLDEVRGVRLLAVEMVVGLYECEWGLWVVEEGKGKEWKGITIRKIYWSMIYF